MANARRRADGPSPPSLLDSLLPIVVLICLLALTIVLFGVSATDGPLQVALLLSAAFASLVAFKNGHTVASVAEAAVGGVTVAMGAIFILLAVGALIGTWNMAGTIPTVVDYGIRLVSPAWFYVTTAAVCALVGMVTGSSWTTAGTLGVAFVGMSKVLGLDEAAAAGAVICGAYFGDTAVGDHDPGAPAGRWRTHGRAARAQHGVDSRTRVSDQPRGVLLPGAGRRPRRRGQHR
jgi:Na+:H+ antiporter, NhaC family